MTHTAGQHYVLRMGVQTAYSDQATLHWPHEQGAPAPHMNAHTSHQIQKDAWHSKAWIQGEPMCHRLLSRRTIHAVRHISKTATQSMRKTNRLHTTPRTHLHAWGGSWQAHKSVNTQSTTDTTGRGQQSDICSGVQDERGRGGKTTTNNLTHATCNPCAANAAVLHRSTF